MAETMKAWQYTTAAGGLEKTLYNTTTFPTPSKNTLSPNQIFLQVISASLNPVDYKIPELGMVGKIMIPTPAIPGHDFCAKVVATHDTNDTLKVGQKVFGALGGEVRYGSCGEYIVAKTEECVPLPEGVDEDDAAAVGVAGKTAYQCLKPYIKAGMKVFINGGSGGTGTFGIQIAKILGGHITTSCSTGNVALCKELGADEVIDYKTNDLLQVLKTQGQVFDLVVDNVGAPATLYKECHHFLKAGCKFIQVGAAADVGSAANLVKNMALPSWLGGGQRPFQFLTLKANREDFAELGKWLAEGKMRTVIDQVFEWEDVPKAFEKLKTGRTRGKIAVHVTAKG
ncbi:GroES-like protein [Tothia fuscella]|uniref:GroES-like protein n=1 Tax=Tothia fuscella TaxID=1048955 RepID=A0A9P4NDF1_9PEZI|nr:GroES-like protein [Tothia fuscella]